jgi:hypothetical protein
MDLLSVVFGYETGQPEGAADCSASYHDICPLEAAGDSRCVASCDCQIHQHPHVQGLDLTGCQREIDGRRLDGSRDCLGC